MDWEKRMGFKPRVGIGASHVRKILGSATSTFFISMLDWLVGWDDGGKGKGKNSQVQKG